MMGPNGNLRPACGRASIALSTELKVASAKSSTLMRDSWDADFSINPPSPSGSWRTNQLHASSSKYSTLFFLFVYREIDIYKHQFIVSSDRVHPSANGSQELLHARPVPHICLADDLH